MRPRPFLLLIAGVVLALMAAGEASAARYDISGFVMTDETGLSGATVSTFNTVTGAVAVTTTLEDGWFSLNNIEAGEYKFGYAMAGYLSVVNDVTVDRDGSMDDVILGAAADGSGSFAGTVTDGVSGIDSAIVTLVGEESGDDWWGGSAGYERTTTTDGNGNFSFSGLASESFTLRVTAGGYYSSTGSDSAVVLAAVNDNNLKYVRILDGDGNTLSNAEVMLYEAATATWTAVGKLGDATHVVRPSAAANANYIFAFHEDYATGVILPGDGGGENLEIVLTNGSTGVKVAALPGVPAVTSDIPVMDVSGMTVLLLLNPGPTADVQITSETTLFDGLHVVALDEEVSFSAAESSAAVGILMLEWNFGGSDYYTNWEDGQEVNNTWGAAGSYTVNLTVMDRYNFVNTSSLTVLVDASAPAPAFNVLVKDAITDGGEPYNGTNVDELDADEAAGSTLVFNSSGSSDGQSYITSWEWDFGDNTTNSGEVVNKQYLDPGDYPVSLTTTDAAGNSASVAQTVHVNDITRPGPVAFTYYEAGNENSTDSSVTEGVPITFNANLTQDNYDPPWELTFQWNFGDGSNGSGMQVEHVFVDVPNEWLSVLLTVTDRAGNSVVMGRSVRFDLFPSDPDEWSDLDGDGVGDNGDPFPSDPDEWADGDGDGVGDNGDLFPSDPDEWADGDGDGVGDNGDLFPSDPDEWADGDGDGVGDNGDAFPETAWLRAWWQVWLPGVSIFGGVAIYGYNQYTLARKASGKVDELRAKIAEFKEKGINTDELERVLAECEAEMGAMTESEE
jgi:PKD repeat protein